MGGYLDGRSPLQEGVSYSFVDRRAKPRYGQSSRLANVAYDVRGPVLEEALRLERDGVEILKLNLGNPAPFGLNAPQLLQDAVAASALGSSGYSDSRGLLAAREAVVSDYLSKGVNAHPNLVWLGNGVSELIPMALTALLDPGDEVLIPAPDYPLWTASVTLAGGVAVHYLCDESEGWCPDLDMLSSLVTDHTRAIVLINPNNPTGAVYTREVLEGILDLAAWHGLVVFADEIYDRMVFEGIHVPAATLRDDVLVVSFNGLSKAFTSAGYRAGWMAVTGPLEPARGYLEGISVLANMRLCSNVMAQHAVIAALENVDEVGPSRLISLGGRLRESRDAAMHALGNIPSLSCVTPAGALYAFPKLDTIRLGVADDESLVLDLLREERVLLVQGTAFNWPAPDHLRIVLLPEADVLTEAIGRLGAFLGRRDDR